MISAFRNTLAGLVVAAAFAPSAMAQDAKNQGYLVDVNGNVVTSSTTGLCVRSSDWTPARAAAAAACKQCTPDLCPKPKPAAKPAPKPKPAAKPAPKPKPEAKPEAKPKPKPKPQFLNVELKIELQGIAFNKTELTEANKKELDAFLAKQVKPLARIGAVIITGHTDRIGSDKYNKTLSEKRALGAKDYVVSKGIDQKLIFWEGKGEKQPIPVTKFCDNKMKRAQLIECLAPNRRVTMEVVGAKLKPAPKPKPEAKPEAKPKPKPKPKAR
ncbi:MAG: OmpA family protein [Betaproteobacteria bacterium]|nr:OmpA family protein [Betaproteobacteria bacterium]